MEIKILCIIILLYIVLRRIELEIKISKLKKQVQDIAVKCDCTSSMLNFMIINSDKDDEEFIKELLKHKKENGLC